MYELTAQAPPEHSLAEVVQAIEQARANPAAFQPLYEEYFPRIYRYCLRRVTRLEEAEDLTSVVFTRALANLSQYRGGSFAAWIFRIAHNAVVNHLRGRRHSIPLEEIETLSDGDEMLSGLVKVEEQQRVARLIAALPDEDRELLALKVSGGLSAKEIGLVIGKSEGAVRVAIHRIVERLRAAWTKEEER